MRTFRLLAAGTAILSAWPIYAQRPVLYTGTSVTGQLVLSRTVNALETAQRVQFRSAPTLFETNPKAPPPRLRPPNPFRISGSAVVSAQGLQVAPATNSFGFDGLSHRDQRLANNGNQYNTEPPNPGIAVANGKVLVGVNNAVQVYTQTGTPLLPKVLSSNELFGVSAAIDRATGINGVYPTDMRVFFDHTINRWFVLQRAQDYDAAGFPVSKSHLYLAVSRTDDPIGTYNIYTMETTDAQKFGCPCVADYPQIGADQYGFYISYNQFNIFSEGFAGAQILAISKASLLANASAPTVHKFALPFSTTYEFAIQPATTPPGASYFLGNGGLQYFVSSNASAGNAVSIWAMYNTASLGTANPSPTLTQITVPTLSYSFPDAARQRPGPLPYGSTRNPPRSLALIDGGDTRILSVSYAGGRLYATMDTNVLDETGRRVVGSAYMIFSPTFRAGVLSAPVLRQGYLLVKSNHLLRPSIAVNAQGRGAIAFTLVGPDYYPSAAYVAIDAFSTSGVVQLARAGFSPQDGFTGYPPGIGVGIARWGDYSAAVATSEGTVWMTTEYIPATPPADAANWGTFVVRYVP